MKTKMRKGFRRAASLLCAIVMAITCAAMTVPETAYADDTTSTTTGSITVKNTPDTTHVSISGKTFNAYQIFTLTIGDTSSTPVAYSYELNTVYKDAFEYAAGKLDVGDDKTDTTIQYYDDDGNLATLDTSSNDSIRAFMDSALYEWTKDETSGKMKKGATTTELMQTFANALKEKLPSATTGSETGSAKVPTASVTVESGKEEATFENLPFGYYLITGVSAASDDANQEVITACMLDTAAYNETDKNYAITIDIKVGIPTCDKIITEVDDKTDTVKNSGKAASGEIGDIVEFEVDSCLPNLTGYTDYTYTMTDTFSTGLDLVYSDSSVDPAVTNGKVTDDTTAAKAVTVKIGDTDVTSSFTCQYDSTNKILTVKVKDFDALQTLVSTYKAGTTVKFTYSAKINSSAVVGQDGNENKAKVTYSNDPSTDTTNDTPESKVKVYTFALDLLKYTNKTDDSGTTTQTKLSGAKFLLYDASAVNETTGELESGATPLTISTEAGTATPDTLYSAQAEASVKVNGTTYTNQVLTSDANGKIVANGLKEGTYYLKEIEAPAGYNLKEDLIPVTYTPTYTDDTDKTKLTDLTLTSTEGTSLLYKDSTGAYTTDKEDSQGNTNKLAGLHLNIQNNTGSELPSTGGYGLTIIYIIGGLLMALAVISTTVKKLARNTR